ncbi:MAG TPA: lipopolysaccharide biosynthesis protein [Stellaceae bacterium]|nr:lipopolysaccharide biosynthesis protein [Stellaceae bacterium]
MILGTLALTVVNVLKLGMQIAVLPVLARILGPSAFGLVALAMPLILLANMVSDAGLGNALVRVRNSSKDLESTIFWFSLAMSLGLAVIISLLAWPISIFLSVPTLVPIIIALTVILPLGGSLSVSNALISREGKFTLFAMGDVISSLTSSAAAIVAALAGAGAWSLVIQQCVLWIVKVSWLLPVSGFHPGFVCKPRLAWPHLGFGLNAVGANLADFANKNLPTVVIGGLIGVAAAGHYSMGYQIVRVPELIISGPLYLSIFASVAQWGEDRRGTAPLALRGLRGIVTALAPLFCGMALVAHVAVLLLLGPAWAPTAPILMLLAPAGFFLCVYSFIGAIFMGLGHSHYQFRLTVLCGCFLAAGTLLGAHYGGEGVAAGFSIGAVLVAPVYLVTLSKLLVTPIRAILHEIASPLVATLAMAVAVIALTQRLPAWNPALQLSALALCGVVTFTVVLALIAGRQLWRDLQWLLATNRQIDGGLVSPRCD